MSGCSLGIISEHKVQSPRTMAPWIVSTNKEVFFSAQPQMHTGTLEHSTAFSTQPTNIQALYGSQQGQFGLEDLNKCRSVSNSLL